MPGDVDRIGVTIQARDKPRLNALRERKLIRLLAQSFLQQFARFLGVGLCAGNIASQRTNRSFGGRTVAIR